MVNDNRADGIQRKPGVNPSAVIVTRDFTPKKQAHQPMTVEDMCTRLGDAGFKLNESDASRFILGRFSYQHVSDYIPLFDSPSCDIARNIKGLYLVMNFDHQFQSVVMQYIGLVEHQMRAQFSMQLSLKYGAFAHRRPDCFINGKHFDSYLEEYKTVVRNCMKRKKSRAKRDIMRYGDMPTWEAFEEMPFGMVSKLYMNLKDAGVKKRVARSFDASPRDLESWLSTLSYVRNRCAHFGKLLGETLARPPASLDYVDADNRNPFYIVLLLMRLLRTNMDLGERSLIPSATLAAAVADLMTHYKRVLVTLGIPDNWLELIKSPDVSGLDIVFPAIEGEMKPDYEIRRSKLGMKMN